MCIFDPPRQAIVPETVQVLVAEKHWTGGGGFVVTDEMEATIAGQAALLVLGLDEPYFFNVNQSIIVYPGRYFHPPQWASQGTVSWRGLVSRRNRALLERRVGRRSQRLPGAQPRPP